MKPAKLAFIPSESRLTMQKGIKFVFAVLVVFLSGAAVSTVSAATYYVATNGLDTNPGTFAQPWKTIGKAASVMVAGDTTYIRGGTYNITSPIIPANSGSAGNYITFSAYQDEVPIINGPGLSGTFRVFTLHSSQTVAPCYFRFVGLTMQNLTGGGGGGIGIEKGSLVTDTARPHHIEILNCKFNTLRQSAIKIRPAYDIIIAGMYAYDCKGGVELKTYDPQTTGNNYNTENIIILDSSANNLHRDPGSDEDGIVAGWNASGSTPTAWCENVYISGFDANDCGDDGIDLRGRYFTVEHCISHKITSTTDSHGFKIYAVELPVDEGRYYADFYRCLVYNSYHDGFKLSSLLAFDSDQYVKKIRMLHCTAAGNPNSLSLVTNDLNPMDVIIKNSIIPGTTYAWEITAGSLSTWSIGGVEIMALPSYLTLDSDYNLWYAGANSPINYLGTNYSLAGWQSFSGQDGNSISVNPTFDANYHPGNSACIDSGTDVGLPYAGDAPDMGFFESGMVEVNCPANYLTTGENWISIPVAAINDGPYSVFKDLGKWPNSVYHNLYRYNSPTASFAQYPTYQSDTLQFGKITPGGAYKLMLGGNQTSLKVSGIELSGTQTLTISGSGTRDFYFGDPFNKALYKSHCRIKNGTNEVSIAQAISNGWVGNVQHFNSSSKSWETIGNILEKWHAYRLTAYTTGELQLIMYDLPAGDLDGDGDVDLDDLDLMTGNWLVDNCGNRPVGALDEDCDVDFKDYAVLAGNWLEGT